MHETVRSAPEPEWKIIYEGIYGCVQSNGRKLHITTQASLMDGTDSHIQKVYGSIDDTEENRSMLIKEAGPII